MKYSIIAMILLFSFSSNMLANEEKSLLNLVQEQAGVNLTDEQKYTIFIKNELLNTINYQTEIKRLKKVDEAYLSVKGKIKSIKNIEDIFKNDFMFYDLELSNIYGEKEKVKLYDFIFNISFQDKDNNKLKIFLNNLKIDNENEKINFNFTKNNLEEKEIKEKITIIFEKLYSNEKIKKALLNQSKVISERNDLFDFNNILEYQYYTEYYNIVGRDKDFKINPREYISFLKKENKIKNESIHSYFKENLEKDIKDTKKLRFKKEIIDLKNPLSEIPEYGLKNYYLIHFEYETTLVQYLLQATNDNNFSFKNNNDLFKIGLNEDKIKELFYDFYKIEKRNIKINNISEKVISFNNNKFFKTVKKESFK